MARGRRAFAARDPVHLRTPAGGLSRVRSGRLWCVRVLRRAGASPSTTEPAVEARRVVRRVFSERDAVGDRARDGAGVPRRARAVRDRDHVSRVPRGDDDVLSRAGDRVWGAMNPYRHAPAETRPRRTRVHPVAVWGVALVVPIVLWAIVIVASGPYRRGFAAVCSVTTICLSMRGTGR